MTSRRAVSERNRLMNPAPAISTRATHGEGSSASISAAASSRGLRLRVLASCSATLLE